MIYALSSFYWFPSVRLPHPILSILMILSTTGWNLPKRCVGWGQDRMGKMGAKDTIRAKTKQDRPVQPLPIASLTRRPLAFPQPVFCSRGSNSSRFRLSNPGSMRAHYCSRARWNAAGWGELVS